LESAPWVLESLPSKTKDTLSLFKKIFGDLFNLILKHKEIRAGRGKSRGRKYKSNAGLLLITGKDEKAKIRGIEVRSLDDVEIADLYPLGRLTLYTKKALVELGAPKK
jgi:large subunit ribosomal protein L4e